MGHPRMNPKVQIQDALDRGWIILAPDHRLCPQVNILEGPIGDIRFLHQWVHAGHLDTELSLRSFAFSVDKEKIVASGIASGAHSCLCLAFDIKPTPPPAAIIGFNAPMNFSHPWWTGKREKLDVNVPELTPEMESMVFSEHPVPSQFTLGAKPDASGKIRLPDSDPTSPTFQSARQAYAMTIITRHELVDRCYPFPSAEISPNEHYRPIDPILNANPAWPPTCFVHGTDDNLLPHEVTSSEMSNKLQQHGVKCKFVGIEGAHHMFAMRMTKDSREWAEAKVAMDWVMKVITEGAALRGL